jgi:outer membrane protein OmpA-like peptidoglycan-associated protein
VQAKVTSLQKESEFKDAWLYTGVLEGGALPPVVIEKPVVQVDPPKDTTAAVIPDVAPPVTADTVAVAEIPAATPDSAANAEPEVPAVVRGKLFRFVLQTADGKPVKGEVHNVDFNRGRDLATYKTDKYIDILRPSNANNPMSLVCGIFGYKEVVRFMDYNNPSTIEGGSVQDAKGAWVIPYTLERMKKGDVSVMYHVAFYKDAVVMLPESKSELDELVSMMTNNPNYRIKIHGHCNTMNSKKIIAVGKSKNYFTTKGAEEVTGNAKELSRLRAVAVQNYLIDHGIDKSRADIYAWGSQNMLAPENGPSAKLNDRIEIEITAN